MSTLAQDRLLTRALRLIPTGLYAALDDWSYRVARQRAERRRQLGAPAAPQPAISFTEYKLRPWRD